MYGGGAKLSSFGFGPGIWPGSGPAQSRGSRRVAYAAARAGSADTMVPPPSTRVPPLA